MMRAFSSAVAGMRSQMAYMDVVANNIANVNTTAFKASRARFGDLFYQTLAGATNAPANAGSVNPVQIGLGASLMGVDSLMNQGALRATANPLDLAIEGEGFFAVSDGTSTFYTRDGAFGLDATGQLVTGRGMLVMDSDNAPIQVDMSEFSAVTVTTDGRVIGTNIDGSGTTEIATIGITTFRNAGGLDRAGDNLWRASAASGDASNDPEANGQGRIRAGVLEASNVDLAQEFSNMISAQRGFQANTRVISSSDELLQDLVNIKR